MRDVLPELERWAAEGIAAATATVVRTERSAPRAPGAVLGVSEHGEVVGSVTGGCVEPAVYEEAREVLAGGPPRLVTYGIADEDAFEVGLPCGGTVHIFVDSLDPRGPASACGTRCEDERPLALVVPVERPEAGQKRLVLGAEAFDGRRARGRRARGPRARREHARQRRRRRRRSSHSFAPRPQLYVFGAVDHAAAIARQGRFLGYRVTVCDARAKFVTRERFPDADELVVEWPDRFLARRRWTSERRSASSPTRSASTCRSCKSRSRRPRATSGRWGRGGRTRAGRSGCGEAGVSEEAIERIHAPIGLDIGSRSPEEVAVSVAAEIVAVMRGKALVRAEPVAS